MKLSLVLTPNKTKFSPLLFAGNMNYGIKRAAELGYDGIEINIRDSTKINQNHMIDMINSYNLKLISFGTGQAYYEDGISLADVNPKVRDKAVERLKDHIRFASKVGAQVVIGGIRGRLCENPTIKKIEYKGALEAIKTCASFANELDVTLTIEPINRNETNFINTMQEANDYLESINEENVKLLADTYQLYFEEKSITEAIKLAGEKLVHVHLVDTDRLVPGNGTIDFKPILKTLNEIGYSGYLSAEILPVPDDETAAKQFIKNIRKILMSY